MDDRQFLIAISTAYAITHFAEYLGSGFTDTESLLCSVWCAKNACYFRDATDEQIAEWAAFFRDVEENA